jgi:hypothetical protein
MSSALAPILSMGGSLLGGPAGGAVGGLLGNLFGGNQSQGQATGAYGTAQGQAALPGQLQGQYLPSLLSMMSNQIGNEAQTNPLVFGDLATKSMTPAFNAQATQYGDNVANQLQQTAGSVQHDIGGHGFTGTSSILPAELGSMQRGAQSEVATQKGQVGEAAAQNEQNLAQTQAQMKWQQLLGLGGTIPGANVGGLQSGGNYYQGMANNAIGSFNTGQGSLSTLLSQTPGNQWGWLGKLFGQNGQNYQQPNQTNTPLYTGNGANNNGSGGSNNGFYTGGLPL